MALVLYTSAGVLPFLPPEVVKSINSKIYVSVALPQVLSLKELFTSNDLSLRSFLRTDDNCSIFLTPHSLNLGIIPLSKQVANGKISLQSDNRRRDNLTLDEYMDGIKVFKADYFLNVFHTYAAEVNQAPHFNNLAKKLARKNLALLKGSLEYMEKNEVSSKIFAPLICVGGTFLADSRSGKVFTINENGELTSEDTVRSKKEEIDDELLKKVHGLWVVFPGFHDHDEALRIDKSGFMALITKFREQQLAKNQLLAVTVRDGHAGDLDMLRSGFDFIETTLPINLTNDRKFLERSSKKLKSGPEELSNSVDVSAQNATDDALTLSKDPMMEGCQCFCCVNYKRSYVKHLLERKEILGEALLFVHNFTQCLSPDQ